MSKVINHLRDASKSIAKVQRMVAKGKVLSDEEIAQLAELTKLITANRNQLIIYASELGKSKISIAKMFDLSPARISQIIKNGN